MSAPIFVDWFLVRHAPVRDAREGIHRSLDGEADLSDEATVRRLAAALPADGRWWASPMKRTRQTADRLRELSAAGVPLDLDDRLREQSFGVWHGISFVELWSKIRDLPPHNWSYLAPASRAPGGESYLELWSRVGGFLDSLSVDGDPRPRIVVTHAGVIRALVGHAFALAPSRALALSIDPLSVTRLTQRLAVYSDVEERGGDWQLRYLNRSFEGG